MEICNNIDDLLVVQHYWPNFGSVHLIVNGHAKHFCQDYKELFAALWESSSVQLLEYLMGGRSEAVVGVAWWIVTAEQRYRRILCSLSIVALKWCDDILEAVCRLQTISISLPGFGTKWNGDRAHWFMISFGSTSLLNRLWSHVSASRPPHLLYSVAIGFLLEQYLLMLPYWQR